MLAICRCGTLRQVTHHTQLQYAARYAANYHRTIAVETDSQPYRDRYDHDFALAKVRVERYTRAIEEPVHTALDVGAANGAFVDFLRSIGIDAIGIDADSSQARDVVLNVPLHGLERTFDLVTYHDVLEHIVDPLGELCQVRKLVNPGGSLVLDVPDVFDGAGEHHYKREHLWYFRPHALCDIVVQAGFSIRATDKPIPGKFVLVAA